MEYINYFDLLSFDKNIMIQKEYHNYRKKYRLFKLIGRYLNASILQFNRLEEWAITQANTGNRSVSGIDAIKSELIFPDIHFLLVSMDKCYKFEQMLYTLFDCSKEAYQLSVSKSANTIRLMRNLLEHSDENILDDSKNHLYNLPEVFLNNGWSWLEYQLLSLSDGKFRLKDQSLEVSNDMFQDIINHYNYLAQKLQSEINFLK